MKSLLFLALFLCSCTRHLDRVEPSRGMEQPKQTKQVNYAPGRAMLPALLGFVGGAMYTDNERGRWTQGVIFAGAGTSVFCWKGVKARDILKRAGLGIAGMTIGFLIKNNLR